MFGALSCGVGIFYGFFLLFFLRKWCSSPVHKKGISRRYGGFLEAVDNCWTLKTEVEKKRSSRSEEHAPLLDDVIGLAGIL